MNLSYEIFNMPLQLIKKAVIFTSYVCNNNCLFCINQGKRNLSERSTREILKEIILARQRGNTYLELIGGEPTIRKDIVKLIKFARELRYSTIMLATNGRAFSSPGFAEKLIEAGLNSIIFSIHGHTPALHDFLTQTPGSFVQLKKGIKNVKNAVKKSGKKNILLGSNTTIVKQNYRALPEIGKFIYGLGLKNAEFIFVDPNHGGAKTFFHKLVPKISQAAPYIYKCLDIGKKNGIFHWHIRYVPLCFFQDYLNRISEISEIEAFSNTEHIAPDFYTPNAVKSRQAIGRIKPEKCQKCKLYNKCEGIWKEYLKHYGSGELKPIH
jgi:MoaA/NifB/PqqE/SkfB family radical SAM enzyme